MKKIINAPENYVTEMLEGIYAAHADMVTYTGDDLHCYVSKVKKAGKVGLATGGGSGHLPLFLGYIGEGMLDGCTIGDVFQSPNPEQIWLVMMLQQKNRHHQMKKINVEVSREFSLFTNVLEQRRRRC